MLQKAPPSRQLQVKSAISTAHAATCFISVHPTLIRDASMFSNLVKDTLEIMDADDVVLAQVRLRVTWLHPAYSPCLFTLFTKLKIKHPAVLFTLLIQLAYSTCCVQL